MGIAVHLSERAKRKVVCGSPGFIAPELFQRRGCELKSDVFGCGALLYFLVRGKGPFMGSDKDETMSLNKRAHISFDDAHFLAISWETVEIMRYMLQKHPRRRPDARSAREAVTHVIEMIPPAPLPGVDPHACDHAISEPADPMQHQESDSTSRNRCTRSLGMFSSIASAAPQTSGSSASSSFSGSSLISAARQKLSTGPVGEKLVSSARKLTCLFHRVRNTRTESQP
eukprot:TRINITY_DN9354_c1_g3_i2.p1 TRINITY_DN9354_c1_g3~~TRINITY_DN9354_c1_g3_i2.p1  ORF type:complete len:265 (-),score=17.21 TRINITY_DN9354_c1_g3_i2:653-1336(-)